MVLPRLFSFCSLTLLLFALLLSCSHEPERRTMNTFFYNESDACGTLDPAMMNYRASIWIGSQIFNGLIQLDSALQPAPAIAKSWQVNSDGTVWTFFLRNGIFFHQNKCFGAKKSRLVSAYDVRYSFERICNAQTKSTGFWIFRGKVEGVEEFNTKSKNSALSENDHISGIEVLNDSTLKIHLVKPFPQFLSMLAMPYCFIIPKEAVDFYGNDFFKNPVGTGAFEFSEWKPDIELILNKNTQYFERDADGKQLPYLDKVSISFLRDTKSEFLQFQQGKIDFVSSIDPSFAPTVISPEGKLTQDFSKYQLFQTAGHSIEYYGILLDTALATTLNSPLARCKGLRQALNYAIDRQKIVRFVLNGKGIPAENGVLPPSMPGFSREVKGYSYNPDKARQLLADAGFPNGKGLPTLNLQIGQNERTAAIAEAIQQQWKEIGVNVEIKQVDFPQHLEMIRSAKLPLWRTSWIGDYPDPENFLALFYSKFIAPKGPNTTHFQRRDADSLYEAALYSQITQEQRFKCYNEMERIVLDEAPWIFIHYNVLQRLAQPWIHEFGIDGADRLNLARVKKNFVH